MVEYIRRGHLSAALRVTGCDLAETARLEAVLKVKGDSPETRIYGTRTVKYGDHFLVSMKFTDALGVNW